MNIEEEIQYFCEQKNTSGALLITGDWGSGKTYFFEKILPQQTWFHRNASIINLSLFGITKREILEKKLKEKYILKNLSIPEISSRKKGILLNAKYAATKLLTEADIKLTEKDVALKDLFGAARAFAGGWDNLVQIPSYDKIGKVIIIFDDLERCPMNMEELLGTINSYIEESGIKIILIANEDYILENDTCPKIYKDMKEKIVYRTIKYYPDFSKTISSIVMNYKTNNHSYQNFLKSNISFLTLCLRRHTNIRTMKSAIETFERLYKVMLSEDIPSENHIEIFKKFFSITSSYSISASDSKNNDAMSLWIEQGIWNEEIFRKELQLYKSDDPWKIILRESTILNINDEIWEKGVLELKEQIDENQLDLSDYSNLFQVLLETYKYDIPVSLDISKLVHAIKTRIKNIYSGEIVDFFKHNSTLSQNDKETLCFAYPGIKDAIDLIESIRDKINLLYHKSILIQALNDNNSEVVDENLHLNLGCFDKNFADAIYKYWSRLESKQNDFIQDFMRSFSPIENFLTTYTTTIQGIEHLTSLLSNNCASDKPILRVQNLRFMKKLSEKKELLTEKFNKGINS